MSEVKFVSAIRECDLYTLKTLLRETPDLVHSKLYRSAKSCLQLCFEKNHSKGSYCECVELLVNHGADVNRTSAKSKYYYYDWTAVMLAVHVNCLRCLQFLIDKDADLGIKTTRGFSALILAVKEREFTIVETLIQHSSTELINHKDQKGNTALMWAAESIEENAPSVCQKLLEAGADVNIRNRDGETALVCAAKSCRGRCANVLIQHSTPKLMNHRDNGGRTALMWAAECHGQDAPSLMQQLIEAGADVNFSDKVGNTALILAVRKKQVRNADVLIQHSTTELINHRDNGGRTALIWATVCHGKCAHSLIPKLLEAGADVHISNTHMQTPLMLATGCHGQDAPSFIQQLIEAGTDVNITDTDGNTALILAVKKNTVRNSRVLIQHSTPALINHRDNGGKSALMWAILKNCNTTSRDISLYEHIIEAGADIHLEDNNKETSLSFALEKENENVVSLLLKKGAGVNTISISGKTLLYNAFKKRNWSLLNQLLNEGADPTLSFRHTEFIHQSIANNDAATLHTLVLNGFPPLDCTFSDNRHLRHTYNLQQSVSPLSLALWENKPAMARYLITNKFFTPSDINQTLAQNKKLRRRLTQFETNECLQILDVHLQTVQTLFTLCSVTITSALIQDFRKINALRGESSTDWRFTPTFKERVESLGLPEIVSEALLRQTLKLKICCKK